MQNVLLIDDDAFTRGVVRRMLENLECTVTEAEDGRIASTKLDADDFDLVVTDIFMPNQDGIETIRKIRRSHNDVCILAISSDEYSYRINYLKMAERIGANFALKKPIQVEQLANILRSIRETV